MGRSWATKSSRNESSRRQRAGPYCQAMVASRLVLPFDVAAVREVVEKPWAALGRPVPEPKTAPTIAERWRADERGIPPAELSLLLTGAQERLANSKAERLPAAWFSEPTLEQIRAFLDDALRDEPPETRRSLEEQFISAQGYRTRVYEGEVAMPAESLARLAGRGLLNYHRGAPGSYELAHDLLSGVLRASRDARRAAEEAGRLAEAEERAAVLERARRRAVRWAAAAAVIALVAIGALLFALKAQWAANDSRQRAVAARKAADELVRYMQYDLRNTLESVGRLSLMKAVDERIARYHKEYPPEAGDLEAEREVGAMRSFQGDVLLAQGNLAEALAAYRDYQKIAEHLVAAKADNTLWQRDLSVSYDKVGDVLVAQGQLADALKTYRDSLAIRERLAKADPQNAGWQRDLAIGYEKLAALLSVSSAGRRRRSPLPA
jgi:tetratricopeptide (TPR) repeat protein